MERRIYSSAAPTTIRKEWIEFPDGRSLCIHGLTTAQYTALKARSARSPGDPRGGEDPAAAILIQIVMSCFDGDGPDAQRIFGDLDLDKAGLLSFEEFLIVMAAVNRVNGLDSSLQELVRDFTRVQKEPNVSP